MITVGIGHSEHCFCPHTPKIARSHISETYIGQDKSIQILLSVTVHSNISHITHSADSTRENRALFLISWEAKFKFLLYKNHLDSNSQEISASDVMVTSCISGRFVLY